MPSLQKKVAKLPPEHRMAAVAALVLVLSMGLPWYRKSYVPQGKSEFVTVSLSAFGVFTFVEAAILLVAAGVLFLVWARMEGKGFHLPGGDGLVIMLAGGWAALLLIWRVFDRPGDNGPSTEVGIQWGFIGGGGRAGARRAPAGAAQSGRGPRLGVRRAAAAPARRRPPRAA